MSPDATYDEANHRWNGGSEHAVANDKYAGNLLFYTTRDVKWAALQPTDSIQGTFISAGTISVQQHMTLAGQLLADKISINAEFDGSGFRYVPLTLTHGVRVAVISILRGPLTLIVIM